MMQRNSGGSQRVVILVAVVAVLFVGVLYFMKRVEANRLSGTLDALQVSTIGTVYSQTLFSNYLWSDKDGHGPCLHYSMNSCNNFWYIVYLYQMYMYSCIVLVLYF